MSLMYPLITLFRLHFKILFVFIVKYKKMLKNLGFKLLNFRYNNK